MNGGVDLLAVAEKTMAFEKQWTVFVRQISYQKRFDLIILGLKRYYFNSKHCTSAS